MSLFQCEKCGCCENTALSWQGHWGGHSDDMTDSFDWSDNPDDEGLKLCSACGPARFADGEPNKKGGGWHGQFERVFLPKGMFETNREGNLEHKENGDTDFRKYTLTHPETEMECPNCQSEDITDHNEFGLPGGYRYWCHECGHLFGELEAETE